MLREGAVSRGSDDIGPKGATQLIMMAPGSISETPFWGSVFYNIFEILRDQFQLKGDRNQYRSSYSIYEAASTAVDKGLLEEGSVVGLGIYFGCWLE